MVKKARLQKAVESPLIVKARRKLKKQFSIQNKKITNQALEGMSSMISYWLARHRDDRTPLKEKDIISFNQLREVSQPKNKYVLHKMKTLNYYTTSEIIKPLSGRVTSA